ncbi:MAG: nuclear transport factor 2 family protein [Phycisphaerales bacterium]
MISQLRLTLAVFAILFARAAFAGSEEDVDALLSRMHEASKNADVAYFDLFADDAVFFGTDLWERWTKSQFEALYRPYMESGRGWELQVRSRIIAVQPCDTMALFDEVLFSESFGLCRATGAARLDDGAWTIVRYHLDITIPNPVVDEVVPIAQRSIDSTIRYASIDATGLEADQIASFLGAAKPDLVYITNMETQVWLPLNRLIDTRTFGSGYAHLSDPWSTRHLLARDSAFDDSVGTGETRVGGHMLASVERCCDFDDFHIVIVNPDADEADEAELRMIRDRLGRVLMLRNDTFEPDEATFSIELEPREIAGISVLSGEIRFVSGQSPKPPAE